MVEITRVLKYTQNVDLSSYTDIDTGETMSEEQIRAFETEAEMESVLEALSYQDNIELVTQVVFTED